MLFVRLCLDKPDALPLRMQQKDAHRAYLAALNNVLQAGPLIDDAGTMIGSMMVIEANDPAAALRVHDEDPFTKAGLFAEAKVIAWNRHTG